MVKRWVAPRFKLPRLRTVQGLFKFRTPLLFVDAHTAENPSIVTSPRGTRSEERQFDH